MLSDPVTVVLWSSSYQFYNNNFIQNLNHIDNFQSMKAIWCTYIRSPAFPISCIVFIVWCLMNKMWNWNLGEPPEWNNKQWLIWSILNRQFELFSGIWKNTSIKKSRKEVHFWMQCRQGVPLSYFLISIHIYYIWY